LSALWPVRLWTCRRDVWKALSFVRSWGTFRTLSVAPMMFVHGTSNSDIAQCGRHEAQFRTRQLAWDRVSRPNAPRVLLELCQKAIADFWVTCGRRPGKNFLTFCSIGGVRSRVRRVDEAGLPAESTLLHRPITIDRAAASCRNCRLVEPVETDTICSLRDRGGCHARSTKRH
jgi:hypothetical protein